MIHPTIDELTGAVHGFEEMPEHVRFCRECGRLVERLRGEFVLLKQAEARVAPRRLSRRLLPIAAAAVMLFCLGAILLFPLQGPAKKVPTRAPQEEKKDLVEVFLQGSDEESEKALGKLKAIGPEVLPRLVYSRLRNPDTPRHEALSRLIYELKKQGFEGAEKAARLFERLEGCRVTLDMQAAPVPSLVNYMAEISEINMVVDPALRSVFDKKKVSIGLDSTRLRAALDLVTQQGRFDYDLRYGVLLVSETGRLWKDPASKSASGARLPRQNSWRKQDLKDETSRKLIERVTSTKVEMNFARAKIEDVLQYLRELSRMNLVMDESMVEPMRGKRIDIKIAKLTMDHALELVTLPFGLDVRIQDGVMVIFKRRKK